MTRVVAFTAMDPLSPIQAAAAEVEPGSEVTVDVSLIDATLAMSVEERLQLNDRMLATIAELRAGFAALANQRER